MKLNVQIGVSLIFLDVLMENIDGRLQTDSLANCELAHQTEDNNRIRQAHICAFYLLFKHAKIPSSIPRTL